MTPEEMQIFQMRIADDQVRGPNAPPADAPIPTTGTDMTPQTGLTGFLGRLRDSGERLANNPALQAYGVPGYSPVRELRDVVDRVTPRRSPVEFTREMEGGPQFTELKPMASPDQPVPETAPLQNAVRPSAAQQFGSMLGGGGGSGLQGAVRQAQANQLRTFDAQKDLVEHGADLGEERVNAMADRQDLAAAQQQRHAELQQQADEEAARKHEAFIARNEQLANDIGAQQIDPSRVIGDKGAGEKVMMLIAGALSGAAGQGPQFLQRLDAEVERGVRAQMANVDNKKAALGARQNLFGQMMAESGDRRVAAAQTRNLIYESVKQKLAADAARLGVPEMKNNAQLMMTEIQSTKQDPLMTSIAQQNLAQAQAAAAAQAAARAAAERESWARSMQVAELGLKRDQLGIEAAKLGKDEGDKTDAAVSKLGEALADPKLASGRMAIENSKMRLGINPDGTVKLDANGKPVVDQSQGLPGVGAMADLRDKAFGRPTGGNIANPAAWVNSAIAGLDSNERVSRGDWDKVRLAYQVQITGAGGSDEQMRQITSAFAGAKTPAEQRNAIAQADAVMRQQEARHYAAAGPKAAAQFRANLAGENPRIPTSVRLK